MSGGSAVKRRQYSDSSTARPSPGIPWRSALRASRCQYVLLLLLYYTSATAADGTVSAATALVVSASVFHYCYLRCIVLASGEDIVTVGVCHAVDVSTKPRQHAALVSVASVTRWVRSSSAKRKVKTKCLDKSLS